MEVGREKRRKYFCPDGDDPQVEEHDQSMLLTKLPDQELKLKKERAERALPQLAFKDGGAKFRVHLNRILFEMKRRGLLLPKDGDTCVNDMEFSSQDGDTCVNYIPVAAAAVTEGLSAGAPLTVPDSPATCSVQAVGDMDDNEETGTHRKNLSTLMSCNHKNANINGDYPSQLTDDIGLSSRKTPLKTGSHLPVNIGESSESNCELAGDISSTSPSHPHQDPASLLMMKTKAPHLQTPRRSRRNNKPVVLVDEVELEDHLTYEVDEADTSVREDRIYYPSSDDPKAIEILHSDMECLDPEAFLSSSIMNFYIKYLQKKTSSTTTKGCNFQIFNTYFYKKLQLDVLKKIDKETSFEKFRRWWKGINLFEKAYILIPIHESLHWSLVIICIPDKEDESGIVILHLDSLGVHSSNSICKDVKSFLIEEWNYLKKKVAEPPIAGKLWDKLSRRITMEITEVPQQKNEYDCGLFVLFFMERFLDEAPERLKMKDKNLIPNQFGRQWFRPEEASDLRLKIKDLLTEEFAKARKERTCNSDS